MESISPEAVRGSEYLPASPETGETRRRILGPDQNIREYSVVFLGGIELRIRERPKGGKFPRPPTLELRSGNDQGALRASLAGEFRPEFSEALRD